MFGETLRKRERLEENFSDLRSDWALRTEAHNLTSGSNTVSLLLEGKDSNGLVIMIKLNKYQVVIANYNFPVVRSDNMRTLSQESKSDERQEVVHKI